MKSKWNARADSASTIILWVGSLIAGLICVIWLAKNISPDHVTLQQIDNELSSFQRTMNTACLMDSYWKLYSPNVRTGSLIMNEMQACIDSSECNVVYYSGGEEPVSGGPFGGGDISISGARNCSNPLGCNRLYFNSDNEPVFYPGNITIYNASVCSNKHEPIIRCRLLTCNISLYENIHLKDIEYVNITRQNGTFNVKAQ
jgi:hypothetical protein